MKTIVFLYYSNYLDKLTDLILALSPGCYFLNAPWSMHNQSQLRPPDGSELSKSELRFIVVAPELRELR